MKILCRGIVASLALLAFSAFGAEIKDWTVLVFINGNNNLDKFGAQDINEMEKSGAPEGTNVLVQYASLKEEKTTRYLINNDENFSEITSPAVEQLGIVDMGDYKKLVEFVKWGAEKYPAKQYFVVVWNHGNGWRSRNGLSTLDISYDDISGNKITTPQLGLAMDEVAQILGQKIDILGFDACLMAMAEVGHEIANSVAFTVGSQETEPGDGWPYDRIFSAWNLQKPQSAKDVSKLVVDEYTNYYLSINEDSITQSAFDLSYTAALNAGISKLAQSVRSFDLDDRRKFKSSMDKAIRFTNSDYADLGDLLNQLELANSFKDAAIISELRSAISQYVIRTSNSKDLDVLYGVSVWAPRWNHQYRDSAASYELLKFKETGWGEALKLFF